MTWLEALAIPIALWLILIGLSLATYRLPWAMLMPASKLSPTLLLPHDDWPWPFKKLSRRISAFPSERRPVKLLGTCPRDHNFDVPADGTWVVTWPFHVAWMTKKGSYWRLPGLRYTYEEAPGKHYYNLGVTAKQYER